MASSSDLLRFEPLVKPSQQITIDIIQQGRGTPNPGVSYAEESNGKYTIKNIIILVGYIFNKANNKLVNFFDPCASIRGLLVAENSNQTGQQPNLIIKSEDAKKHFYILSKGNNWKGSSTFNIIFQFEPIFDFSSRTIQSESTDDIKVCKKNDNQLDIYLNGNVQCDPSRNVTNDVINIGVLKYTYYYI